MAEVVFVLGAGASKECGAPLMGDFLDVADDLRLTSRTGGDAEHFDRVFKSIAALKSVQAQLTLDTYNLEAVFSAFEMGAMISRLGSIDNPDDIIATRKAMTRVIARTLQETILFRRDHDRLLPPERYSEFVQLLMSAPAKVKRPPSFAIITLNYDIALDFALTYHSVPYSYGLTDEKIGPIHMPLLKLHGSLNWGCCPTPGCDTVIPWDLASYLRQVHFTTPFSEEERDFQFNIADELYKLRHEEHSTSLANEPVVVPPTWNKSDNRLLRNVWRHAARELSEARYLVFVGYSFPETDLYFRYLLGLGLAAGTRIRRIIVANPDGSALQRLEEQLSPVMRKRVFFESNGFGQSMWRLFQLLELSQ